jgi:hypothetical protein
MSATQDVLHSNRPRLQSRTTSRYIRLATIGGLPHWRKAPSGLHFSEVHRASRSPEQYVNCFFTSVCVLQ